MAYVERPVPARVRAAEQFAKDTEGFTVQVLHEDGDYRHIRFGKPGERWGSTDIHTWPGGLVTAGDMADGWMFERGLGFFAGKPNLHYWQEKLSPRCRDASKEFSIETLRESVADAAADLDVPEQFRGVLNGELRDLLYSIEWGHADTAAAISELEGFTFACENEDGTGDLDIRFIEPWEMDVEDYTYHFVWACHVLSTVARHLAERDRTPLKTFHECGRCGWEEPAAPGVPSRGCPRCNVTVTTN